MIQRKIGFWCVSGLTSLVMANQAYAAVVTVGYYRLGEDDSGAASGNVSNAVTIGRNASGVSTPGLDLSRVGSPVYTNSLSATATASTGSTLGMAFNGTNGYTRSSALTTVKDNFGLEAWFKWTSGQGVIAVNGDSGGSGFSILVADSGSGLHYEALYGGVAFLDSGVAADNNWHHMAVVRSSGTSRLYLDGSQIGGTFGSTPNTPASGFGIGRNFSNTASFNGSVDEVRLFTFTAGQFTTSDLLIPEPTSLALIGVAGLGLLRRRRSA